MALREACRRHAMACALAPVIALAFAACGFDETPILPSPDAATAAGTVSTGAGGVGGVPSMPPGAVVASPDAGDTPLPPGAFGLDCGGETCPVAPLGATQCCTTVADVTSRAAREGDHCGVDVTAAGGAAGCHQLEQSGVLDPSCPADQPPGSSIEEAGCCSDEGWCGTFDVARGIGCRHGDGPEQRCDDEVDMGVTCEATGHFAVQAAIDVAWGGRGVGGLVDITDDGRGDIVIKLLATIEKVKGDQTFDAKVRACSVVLPAFRSSVLCEAYEPIFPDTIWDSPTAPRFGTSGRYQCLNPGCILTFEALTGLVGIELDDPGGLWPTPADSATFTCASGMAADCYPDHDDDKRPGISVLLAKDGAFPNPGGMTCSQGYTRRAAPLNANPLSIFGGVRRTDRLLLGTRVRLGGSGRISADCAGGDGGGIAEFVESRAAGCYVQEGTADPFGLPAGPDLECNATEAKFIDENLPVYTILRAGETPDAMLTLSDTTASAGPRFGLRRLGALSDDVDCADVRGATF